MPNEWRPLSRIIINGVEYQVTDEIVQGLLEVISENNTEVSLRINDLNSRINNNYSYVQDITSFLPSYANVISDWNETDSTVYTYIKNKPTIPTLVKSDWNETDTTSFAYIQNKPSIPDDSNLVHKTGNETISGTKRFNDNIYFHGEAIGEVYFNDELHESQIRLKDDGDKGWVQIIKGNGTTATTLQAALDERNNVQSDWNVSDNTSFAYIQNKPTIPDITGKADKSDAIGSLSLALDQSTYVITLSGTKVDGTQFTVNNQIDLPLESVVVGGNYNDTTKKVELTLKSGSTVEFSVADLVAGLQSEITSSNKLSADLIEDGTTNKVINVQSDWNVSDTTSNAYILNKPSIPDDSNLVHKSGNETISGTKTFGGENVDLGLNIGGASANIVLTVGGPVNTLSNGEFGWISVAGKGNSGETLQQALDKRNNVQSDWNVSDNTSYAYIKNKPNIPTLVNANWNETDPNSPAYIQNTYIVSDELTYLRMAYTALVAEYEDDNYVISTALTNLDSRITTLSNSSFSGDYVDLTNKPTIPTLVKSDWNVTDTTSYAYILNKPDLSNFLTIETQPNWNETNTSSAAYIQNKPTIPDDSNLVHKTGNETIFQTKTFAANGEIHLASGWHQIYDDDEEESLQEALNARNNVQADWNQTATTSLDYIKNKPDISVLNKINFSQLTLYIGNNLNKYLYLQSDDGININVLDDGDINLNTEFGGIYFNNKEIAVKDDIPTVSTTVTQNDTNPVSGGAVYAKFADLIGAAPAALDTLQEIATALNNDADLAGTLTTQIGAKIPKVSNPTTDNFASFNSDGTIKDSTYSASSFITSIKTVNNESLVGSGNVVISGLPQVSSADNGKILMVVNGQWQLVSPSVLYTGQGVPNNAQGNNGDLYMQTD